MAPRKKPVAVAAPPLPPLVLGNDQLGGLSAFEEQLLAKLLLVKDVLVCVKRGWWCETLHLLLWLRQSGCCQDATRGGASQRCIDALRRAARRAARCAAHCFVLRRRAAGHALQMADPPPSPLPPPMHTYRTASAPTHG